MDKIISQERSSVYNFEIPGGSYTMKKAGKSEHAQLQALMANSR